MAKTYSTSAHRLRLVAHASTIEEFSAHNRTSLLAALLRALKVYEHRQKHDPDRADASVGLGEELKLQYFDPWGTRRDGTPSWLDCLRSTGTCPELTAQAAFADRGASLWETVEFMAMRSESFARFFGYHSSSEHQLRDLFEACQEDNVEAEPTPRLRLIRNGRKPRG